METAIITFSNVTKMYKKNIKALDGINFKVEKGECVFLTGPSGSGKSTIIKLITAEEHPTWGSVVVDNYRLNKLKSGKLPHYRRDLGIVYQDFRLIETKTVWDNMYCIMRGLGMSSRAAHKLIPQMLDKVGILNRKDNYPCELSGGEQQRLAIARAICSSPKIIIADEPTGNLDPENSIEIMRILMDLNKDGRTVLIVTHERDMIKNLGKRIVKIKAGKIVEDSGKENVEVAEDIVLNNIADHYLKSKEGINIE